MMRGRQRNGFGRQPSRNEEDHQGENLTLATFSRQILKKYYGGHLREEAGHKGQRPQVQVPSWMDETHLKFGCFQLFKKTFTELHTICQ